MIPMQTRRERIKALLEEAAQPLTAQDLCNILGLQSRSIIYEDIEHIAQSVKSEGKELLVKPASCGKCNYIFSDRKTAKRPSKCPKCRSEWILSPAYIIRERK
ncbi:MAG: HTH domain-containing protein [Candidatus Thorarchaeota archaeon]|nr:HTH domain-containing protein [Candidatus Thorarchaeota archaeon]